MPKEKSLPDNIRVTFRRTRNLRLSIRSDGRVSVSAPRGLSRRLVDKFIAERSDWISEKLDHFRKIYGERPSASETRKDYLSKKEKARKLIESRLEYFNRFYGFKYKSISVRNQRTRWGSCSRKGSLNFNYRLIDLAPELSDYIVVHELCHLGAFDHSRKFWGLVGKTVPNHMEL
ncbi:MAG: YgjP-like metallopeptidase domain-containing protein, partial [Candidatus Paceibacterota bacterium]